MAFQAVDDLDLITTSLNDLGRLKMTDVMTTYQRTVVLKRLVNKSKMSFDSGPNAQFNLITDENHSARFVGLGAIDVVNANNTQATGYVPWRHITWNWMFERREKVMNSGASKIVDLIQARRIAAMASAIVRFEQSFWRIPLTTDTVSPYGLPYYVVKSATATTTLDGFNGGVPVDSGGTSYSTCANVSATLTTAGKWANYATGYSAVSKPDLVRKMRRAHVYTDFEPIVDEINDYNTGEDLAIYTNYAVVQTLEEILESQNENLGKDIASMDGDTTFRRVPVKAIKELDLDTTNPVYGVNWGVFHTMGLRGEWMNETVIPKKSDQHTVAVTHTDCSLNWICHDRRRLWVISNGTTVLA